MLFSGEDGWTQKVPEVRDDGLLVESGHGGRPVDGTHLQGKASTAEGKPFPPPPARRLHISSALTTCCILVAMDTNSCDSSWRYSGTNSTLATRNIPAKYTPLLLSLRTEESEQIYEASREQVTPTAGGRLQMKTQSSDHTTTTTTNTTAAARMAT